MGKKQSVTCTYQTINLTNLLYLFEEVNPSIDSDDTQHAVVTRANLISGRYQRNRAKHVMELAGEV